MSWLYLALAGIFEVGFTTTFRFSNNLKNGVATIGFLTCLALSLLFLELASRTIPLGTAYTVWTGTGAAGTVFIGMIWFGEPVSTGRVLLMFGIVTCAIGLKMTARQ